MCDRARNTIYADGHLEVCDAVALAEDKIRREIDSDERGDMSEEAIYQMAAQEIHGDAFQRARRGDEVA